MKGVAFTLVRPKNLNEPEPASVPAWPFTKTDVMSTDKLIDERTQLNRILILLSMADGSNSLPQIAKASNCSVDELLPVLMQLEENELIKYNVKTLEL